MTTPYPLILASSSQYRKALLSQLNYPFLSMDPGVNEDDIKAVEKDPKTLASRLALMKAKSLFELNPHSCVIGSDQVCSLGEEIFGKPKTTERACQQLLAMQGKAHHLFTAVSIFWPLGQVSFINTTTLVMRPLSEKQILDYVMLDQPLDCAGSYKLECGGIKLFEKISMVDHTAIIGLPLMELNTHLLQIGFTL